MQLASRFKRTDYGIANQSVFPDPWKSGEGEKSDGVPAAAPETDGRQEKVGTDHGLGCNY